MMFPSLRRHRWFFLLKLLLVSAFFSEEQILEVLRVVFHHKVSLVASSFQVERVLVSFKTLLLFRIVVVRERRFPRRHPWS